MHKLILSLIPFFAFASVFGQNCQADSSYLVPFIHPANDSIPCIVRNVPFSATLTIRNFDSVPSGPFLFAIDSLHIDSISNLPCGLAWLSNKAPSNMYLPHELGCITIAGTTQDSAGQYNLTTNITYYSGGIGQIYSFDGYGYRKRLRVIDSATAVCPPLVDTATGKKASCQGLLVDVVGHTMICQGDSTGLTAFVRNGNGHYSYLWSTGDTTFLLGVNQAGTYSVTVSDGSVTASASNTVRIDSVVVPSVVVLNYDLAGNIDSSHAVCLNTSQGNDHLLVQVSNGGSSPSYDWVINGHSLGINSDTLGFSINRNSGNHAFDSCFNCTVVCVVTSSKNCARPNTVVSDTFFAGLCEGVGELDKNNLISLFPNPSNGQFTFSINYPSQQTIIELYDMQGALLYLERQKGITSLKEELNFSNLAKGVYLLKVTTENGTTVKRVVIE